MRMGQGVRTGLGHGGITCVLQTQFSGLTLRRNSHSSNASSVDPDQMPHFAASDFGVHCLSMFLLWVKVRGFAI